MLKKVVVEVFVVAQYRSDGMQRKHLCVMTVNVEVTLLFNQAECPSKRPFEKTVFSKYKAYDVKDL